jgi:hypothetical protein
VSDDDFGLATHEDGKQYPIDVQKYILDTVEKIGGLSSVSSSQVLIDIYESYFQLYNHLDPNKPKRPFESVAMLPGEMLSGENNRLERSMETYVTESIKEFFDISYIDFMELPSSVVKSMLKIARKRNAARKKVQDEIDAQMGQGTGPKSKS